MKRDTIYLRVNSVLIFVKIVPKSDTSRMSTIIATVS